MGAGASANKIEVTHTSVKRQEDEITPVAWKVLLSGDEARKKFELDGTLKACAAFPAHLEFRTMLEDPISQNAIGKFASDTKTTEFLMCWFDIKEYKTITTDNYRRTKAVQIYSRYIDETSPLAVGSINQLDRERYWEYLEEFKDEPHLLKDDFFDRLHFQCFMDMFQNIYVPFKSTGEYMVLKNNLKKKYNHVKASDFEYFGKLGEGGFGFVIHCKKKSTGRHYAMKLQLKSGLLRNYQSDPKKAAFEKQAFAQCQHPFIVNLDYAFQTDSLAIMVLGLAEGGDLNTMLQRSSMNRLPENLVRFYVAEMILALLYLHQMGLIYRDLKPQNVLLQEDGHIQLVDLGGVMDEEGTLLGQTSEFDQLVPLFSKHKLAKTMSMGSTINTTLAEEDPSQGPDIPDNSSELVLPETKPKRKLSITGTIGYMAPEMVVLLNHKRPLIGDRKYFTHRPPEQQQYSYAVDWWSLGVTMFKLLTGARPFVDDNFQAFVSMATTMNALLDQNLNFKDFAILFQRIPFPDYLSEDAADLITRLLDVNPKTRLGSGPNGAAELKAHRFFAGINWDLLEQKQVEPPYKPKISPMFENPVPVPDLQSLLAAHNRPNWLSENLRPELQHHFADWDFTSPHAMRVEAGLSQASQQYEKSRKLRQLMGDLHEQESMGARIHQFLLGNRK